MRLGLGKGVRGLNRGRATCIGNTADLGPVTYTGNDRAPSDVVSLVNPLTDPRLGRTLGRLDVARIDADIIALLGERLSRRDLTPDQLLALEPATTYELALTLEEAFDVELSPSEVSRACRVKDWTLMVRRALGLEPLALGSEATWLHKVEEGPASERISVL